MTTSTPAETTTRQVTLTVTLTDSMCEDILSTAYEGGIGYWARCLNHGYSEASPNYQWLALYEWEDFCNDTGLVGWQMDRSLERGEHPDRLLFVDYDVIALGVQRILSGEVGIRSDLYRQVMTVRSEDDMDIDSDAADCIVQAGLFAELVYG